MIPGKPESIDASSKNAQAHSQSEDAGAKGFSQSGIPKQEGGSPGEGLAEDTGTKASGKTGPVDDTRN